MCVVKTNRLRVRSMASPQCTASVPQARAATASVASAAWPSFRWYSDGVIPIASSARTAPTPSSAYWASRMERLPS